MKIGEIVLAWVFAVIMGSVICGFFTGAFIISIIFVIVSGLFSMPYLVFMILLCARPMPFIAIQAIHFALTICTGFVIVLFEKSAFSLYYVLILYFVLGVIAQAFFYYRSPLRPPTDRSREDILDF